MSDPMSHEVTVCFSPAEGTALAEHANELGVSLEEYIQRSATGRAFKRLEERHSAGNVTVDVEGTLHQLFGTPVPGAEHRAWANRAIGIT